MKDLVCIVCPNGCSLHVETVNGELKVSGNRCPRGRNFALEELEHPMRTICSTVRTAFPDVPVVPVRVTSPIPKEMIFPVMKEIGKVRVTEPLGTGDKVIEKVLGLDVDIIITSDILKDSKGERR